MKKLLICLLGLALTAAPADAKTHRKKKAEKAKTEAAAKAAEEKRKKEEEAKRPDIDRPGMFHVTKKKGEWFMEIPDSLLGKEFLTTTRFVSTPAGSGSYGGEQCNEQVVYFELNADSTLLLRSSMQVNRVDSADMISKAVTVSNSNPIIGAFKLEKGDRKNHCKIKVTSFFNDDNALGLPAQAKQSFGLGGPVANMCYVQDIKSFPTNTEVRVVKTYNSSSRSLPSASQTGKVTLELNVSFVLLPEQPMMGRYFDPRVGYFTEQFNLFSDAQQRVESKTFISRYRLEPKPEDVDKMRRGELVEPVKPIVYYIDPATPKQWRKYLIQGVNDWQVAFEKAGWKNAIRGEEWPENDSTMSMEDARYCVIRYLASNIPNAYGPHVSDPRTGEILESHIGWYHNVMSLVHDWYMVQASSIDEAARKMKFDEELMGQLIRFVSSHEVGHTLGLRHNFGASSTVPVDSLRNKQWVERFGHTPSIMDYARFNYVAQPGDGIDSKGIFPRINDYDLWAIEWGYRPMLDATNSDEDRLLLEPRVKEAQKHKRLWWGDGEGERNDPRRQTEDLGDDAVKASEYGIRNLKREMAQLESWTKDEKDFYDRNLRTMYKEMQGQYMRYMGHVSRYIGGTYINWYAREDGGTKYAPTPLAKQKESLQFLNEYILQEPKWMREFDYCKTMAADTRDLTTGLAETGAAYLVSRLDFLNELYPAERFIDDLLALSFTETTSGKPVTKYREVLQTSLVRRLTSLFGTGGSSDALYALKSLQRRLAGAVGGDAHTRAHFANLKDTIDRKLVIK
ncbi:MAG: zinc-dependent metalloprotease [Bacteroidaceae bacterium]|nr:zinc-dependent metalloprotease [Bacteroidaceae bacterium]